jgi:hypothetical protein
MRPLGALAFVALALLAGWLAIANREAVMFSFDALAPGNPASSLKIPLFAVLLLGAMAGLIAGSLYMLWGQRALHRQIRQERARADRLQRLLADETLGKTTPAPKARQLSGTSG